MVQTDWQTPKYDELFLFHNQIIQTIESIVNK